MENEGATARPPRIPTHAPMWITVVAIIIATLFASALVYVLLNETSGPGEALKAFYVAMDDGDCADAFELTTGADETKVCSTADEVAGAITSEPRIASITLAGQDGDTATVTATEVPGGHPVAWEIQLVDATWLISRCPLTGELADAC